jgi:predicted phosphodiesterase
MIADEYNGRGLDAVLILGDISTDNNSTLMPQKLNTDYYKQFYNKLRQGLSEKGINNLPIYCVAGNHDSILNDEWKSVMGYDRQYSFAIGNTVFMMLDTFHEDGTADNYGAEYKGVDYAWIEAELKKYDNIENRRVVYCSHAFSGNEYKTLANTYTDSMLFMAGHSHMYTVEEINSHATYINVGGFSYTAFTAATGPNWDFGYLDLRTLWGYQILEWNEDVTYTYHVSIAHEYFATNMYYVLTEDIKTKDLVLRQKEN